MTMFKTNGTNYLETPRHLGLAEYYYYYWVSLTVGQLGNWGSTTMWQWGSGDDWKGAFRSLRQAETVPPKKLIMASW